MGEEEEGVAVEDEEVAELVVEEDEEEMMVEVEEEDRRISHNLKRNENFYNNVLKNTSISTVVANAKKQAPLQNKSRKLKTS